MTQQQRDIKRKLAALRYAEECGNVALTARRFGISRQCFYIWKRAYEKHGEVGLINKRPCPVNMPLRMPREVEEKVLHLRRTYHFGPVRIAWYLERYHGLRV
jgi:transposase-like protein